MKNPAKSSMENPEYYRSKLTVVEFEEHEFIVMDTDHLDWSIGGLCHHPNCKFYSSLKHSSWSRIK